MGLIVPRILYDNRAADAASVQSASSEEPGFEIAGLPDQARGRRWRSQVGHTFEAGRNVLPFFTTNDGNRLAHVVPGNYSTPAAAAAAVQTAMGIAGINPRDLGASLWWRADASTVESDGLVSACADLSAGNHGGSQTTPARRPLWVPNACDGHPGWYFNNTLSQSLNSSALMSALLAATTGNGAVVVIGKLDSDAASSDPLWTAVGAGAYAGMIWTGGGNFSADAHDTVQRQAVKAPVAGGVDKWHHLWWEWVAASAIIAMGDDADDANWVTAAATGNLHADILGATFSLGSTSTNALKGYILEVMIFPSALNESQRRKLTQYIKGRYPSVAANDNTTAAAWTDTNTAAYSSTTKKFTLATNAAELRLLAATAVPSQVLAESIFTDLGYTLTDKTGAATHTAQAASYQSRQSVKVDLVTAQQVAAAVALDHNAGASGGTFTLQGNASDIWLAPTFSQVLSGDAAQRSAYFNAQTLRWFRLLINDVQNPLGYSELGVLFLGPYVELDPWDDQYEPGYLDLSEAGYATFGSHHRDERPQADTHGLRWENKDDDAFEAFNTFRAAVPVFKSFFFAFDSDGDPTNIKYFHMPTPMKTEHVNPSNHLWDISLGLRESLSGEG